VDQALLILAILALVAGLQMETLWEVSEPISCMSEQLIPAVDQTRLIFAIFANLVLALF
jgi:hypothetical protein